MQLSCLVIWNGIDMLHRKSTRAEFKAVSTILQIGKSHQGNFIFERLETISKQHVEWNLQ